MAALMAMAAEQCGKPQDPKVVVSSGLEDPFGIALDASGTLYVSDCGRSHQVKVFTAEGKFIRAIGAPGLPKSGPYDPLHMNNPRGIAVDSKQQFWVTEQDFLPKRVSVWTTGDKELLRNSGEMPLALFKTGGTLELMIGTDPGADPKRRSPVAGDVRLLVTQVKGQTKALIYRPVAPGTPAEQRVSFSSPARTFVFDQVEEVSGQVKLAADGKGNYEISVPLGVLGLNPQPGMRIRGDMGLLRGNGSQTLARLYWSNKATGIVSDVPSEAELLPSLWGVWEFQAKH